MPGKVLQQHGLPPGPGATTRPRSTRLPCETKTGEATVTLSYMVNQALGDAACPGGHVGRPGRRIKPHWPPGPAAPTAHGEASTRLQRTVKVDGTLVRTLGRSCSSDASRMSLRHEETLGKENTSDCDIYKGIKIKHVEINLSDSVSNHTEKGDAFGGEVKKTLRNKGFCTLRDLESNIIKMQILPAWMQRFHQDLNRLFKKF